MIINGMNKTTENAGQTIINQKEDSLSKHLQKQIKEAEVQLQELVNEKDMPVEVKMNRRQEIQKQISDLTQQLRQHKIELRKAEQKEKSESLDKMLGGNKQSKINKEKEQKNGLSQEKMQAMISADISMDIAQVKGKVANEKRGQINVLKSEIKQDEMLGVDTKAKREQLMEAEIAVGELTGEQISTLAEATQKLKDADESEKEDKDNIKKTKRLKSNEDDKKKELEKDMNGMMKDNMVTEMQTGQNYKSVDVYL